MTVRSAAVVDAVVAQVDAGLDEARERLFDLLRIPCISTDPAHGQDMGRAAEWLRDQLAGLGFKVAVKPTAGHPVVLGYHPGPAGSKAPHVLFYGHYDVQPPDPLELWTSPPFDPQLVDGPHGKRVVARGAVDDKGQLMMFVEALRAWTQAGGGIPAPVTVLLEGEEENGRQRGEDGVLDATDHAPALVQRARVRGKSDGPSAHGCWCGTPTSGPIARV